MWASRPHDAAKPAAPSTKLSTNYPSPTNSRPLKTWATLRANESMNEMFAQIIRGKIAAGEPYIDPDTGHVVRGDQDRPAPEASSPVEGG